MVVVTIMVVRGVGIVHTDYSVRHWVEVHHHRRLRRDADWLTDVIQPPVDVALLLAYTAMRRRPDLVRATVAAAALVLVVYPTKIIVGRPNPGAVNRFFGSYPSGHTASILVCLGTAVLFSRPSRRAAAWLWLGTGVLTAAIMASLILVFGHWLSDELASLAIAAVILWCVWVTRPVSARQSPS